MSRLLAGQQMPTFRVIEALAKRAEVNIRWFLTGEGEPFHEVGSGLGVGRFRPIAEELLPGPPEQSLGLLGGLSYPVAEAFFQRRATGIAPREALSCSTYEKVLGGDLLLMETDPRWTPKPLRPSPGNSAALRIQKGNGRGWPWPGSPPSPKSNPFADLIETGSFSDYSPSYEVRIYLSPTTRSLLSRAWSSLRPY